MRKFKGFKLKGKIVLPTAVLVVLLLAVVIVFSITRFNNFADYMMQERIQAAANGIRDIIEEHRLLTIDVGFQVGSDPRIIAGILNEDTPELLRVASMLAEYHNFAFFSIMDRNAYALARTHQPQNYGDLIGTPALRDATLGIITPAYGQQGPFLATVRNSMPIMYNGEIIGGIVAAVSLDTDFFVDRIAEMYDAEVTAFVNGESVASTFRNPDGSRITGTQMPAHIAQIVIDQNREWFDTIDVRGEIFSAFYLPLVGSNGQVIGHLFVGLNNAAVHAEMNTLTLQVALMSVGGLAIALLVLFFLLFTFFPYYDRFISQIAFSGRSNYYVGPQ